MDLKEIRFGCGIIEGAHIGTSGGILWKEY
jgi:hypothetical protein